MTIREAVIDDIKQIHKLKNSGTLNTFPDPNLITDKDCEEYIIVRGKLGYAIH